MNKKTDGEIATVEKWYETSAGMLLALRKRWVQHTNRRTSVFLITLVGFLAFAYWYMIPPPADFPTDQLISVNEGASLPEISRSLEEQHVIRSAIFFRAAVKMFHDDKNLHAGDYVFKEPLSVFSVVRRIALGAYGLEPAKFRIAEGSTVAQMAELLSQKLPRFNKQAFIAKATPQEGYLFPDTYFFLQNANEDSVISTMRKNFDTHMEPLLLDIASSSRSLAEIITMASIVEREAWDSDDRRVIAGVLWRRIDKGMPLQADATFRYINGKGTFDLTASDLKSDSLYNTYTHKGLPPGPIGSPSLDSIKAALHPIDKGYLFYLADMSGVTHFSKTYAQHQEYERLYLGK